MSDYDKAAALACAMGLVPREPLMRERDEDEDPIEYLGRMCDLARALEYVRVGGEPPTRTVTQRPAIDLSRIDLYLDEAASQPARPIRRRLKPAQAGR